MRFHERASTASPYNITVDASPAAAVVIYIHAYPNIYIHNPPVLMLVPPVVNITRLPGDSFLPSGALDIDFQMSLAGLNSGTGDSSSCVISPVSASRGHSILRPASRRWKPSQWDNITLS